jgi:hypothetical protein
MKPSKTRVAKKRSKPIARKQPILESSGDDIEADFWIKVGLTISQVKVLTRLGKRWNARHAPCATMARHLISMALLNLGDTESRLSSLLKYIEAEGFLTLGTYCERTMRQLATKGGAR